MQQDRGIPRVSAAWVRQMMQVRLNEVLSPSVAPAVLSELRRPDANFKSVTELLSADPFIAAKALAMANWLRDDDNAPPLRDLPEAVRLCGMRQIETMVLSVMLVGPLAGGAHRQPPRQDIWRWSFGCAVVCETLGKLGITPGEKESPLQLIDGLLLNLGILVLDAGLGWTYSEVIGAELRPEELASRERKLISVTHHQISLWVLQALGCPANLGRLSQQLDSSAVSSEQATVGQCVELLGMRAAGFETIAGDRFLTEHLPTLGLELSAFSSEHDEAMTRRVQQLLDIFDAPTGRSAHGDQKTMHQAGKRLDRLHRLHLRRSA